MSRRAAALACALGVALTGCSSGSSDSRGSSSLATSGAGPTGSPASCSVSTPDWSKVASQVGPSVVAIVVARPDGQSGGQGSGVVYDDQGHIVTNEHVVSAAAGGGSIQVTFANNRVVKASIVGVDAPTDLAVLKLEQSPSGVAAGSFATDKTVAVGQPVMAVGNPLGLAGTVTTGIVSALNRPVVASGSENATPTEQSVISAIQTSAAINPGNSGGALIDGCGQVVGINSAIAQVSSGSGNIGIGFAIPAPEVGVVAEQLVKNGKAVHPYLGIQIEDAVVAVDGGQQHAARVQSLTGGGPAASAGVRTGDGIIALNGAPVDTGLSLTAMVRGMRVGDKAKLTVVRDGKSRDIEVTLAARP